MKGKNVSWKDTSLETKIFLVAKLSNLKPLTPKGNPRKSQGIDLGSNLDLLWDRVEAKHRQPKTFKWTKEGGVW